MALHPVEEVLLQVINESDQDLDDLEELLPYSEVLEALTLDEDNQLDLTSIEIDNFNPDSDYFEFLNYMNDDEPAHSEISQVKSRNKLTLNRLVNSIDKALDKSNYDPMPTPSVAKVYTAKYGKSELKWTNICPHALGSENSLNFVDGKSEVRGQAKHAMTESAAWSVFITDHIISRLVEKTNEKIQALLDQLTDQLRKKYSFVRLTNEVELKSFIGLIYARGLLSLNTYDVDYLFGKIIGHPIFGATMGKSRFKFLLRFIQFDDAKTRSIRWKRDRFAAFREVFEEFNVNCANALDLDRFLALDETLYPMRTQVGFRHFNPKKPAKYGLLFRSINSSRYAYTHFAMPYAGRPIKPSNSYYVSGIENTVKYLVNGLSAHVSLKGRNITIDRFYTSISLAQWMLSEGITVVGTLKCNTIGLPNEIKSVENREGFSTHTYWEQKEKNLVLSSYVVSAKGKNKRNVLMLSTLQPILGCTKDDGKKKPAIYKLYDFTKGGTDIVDQRIGYYTCKPKSRKWTMTAFCYILDTARVNASTILSLNQKIDPRKKNSFEFGWNLVLQLTRPQIEARPHFGLQVPVKMKIAIILGTTAENISNSHSIKVSKRRCRCCLSAIVGTGSYKKKKNSLSKTSRQCQNCQDAVCSKHAKILCANCWRIKPVLSV